MAENIVTKVQQALQSVYMNSYNNKRVMTHYLKKAGKRVKMVYIGLHNLDKVTKAALKDLCDNIKGNMEKTHIVMWQICYGARNNTHCIAFVYDAEQEYLVTFNSGLQYSYSYVENVDKTIRMIKKYDIVIDTKNQIQNYIQCAGDTFCQSWSLMFLANYVEKKGNLDFVDTWVNESPLKKKQRIGKFMLKHVKTTNYHDYPFTLLMSWWDELLFQHHVDVYWDDKHVNHMEKIFRRAVELDKNSLAGLQYQYVPKNMSTEEMKKESKMPHNERTHNLRTWPRVTDPDLMDSDDDEEEFKRSRFRNPARKTVRRKRAR